MPRAAWLSLSDYGSKKRESFEQDLRRSRTKEKGKFREKRGRAGSLMHGDCQSFHVDRHWRDVYGCHGREHQWLSRSVEVWTEIE